MMYKASRQLFSENEGISQLGKFPNFFSKAIPCIILLKNEEKPGKALF